MYDNNIWPGKFLDNGGFAHNVVHPDIGWDPTGVVSITAAPTDPSELAAATYLVPAGTYVASASATIPAGAALVLARGAELKPGSGATLTIAAEITADPAQIFDLSGGGSVDLTGRALEGANPLWFGAPADGSTSDATATQALIDALPTTGSFLLTLPRVAAGYVFGTGLSAGAGRTLYWRKEVGVTYTGKLPGTVLNDVKDLRRATPQATYVFGAQPVMLPGVQTVNFSNTIGAQSSGTMTFTGASGIPGIAGNADRLSAVMRTGGTGAFVLQAADPSGPNGLALRMGNFGSTNAAPGSRELLITVLENQAYRQVFALSSYLAGNDTFLAGVDAYGGDYACIWRTENAGVTWYPVFGVDNREVRCFEVLNTARTRVIALSSDTAAKCHLTTDGGDTWTLEETFSGETVPSSCALAGGEASGSDQLVVGFVGATTGSIRYSTDAQSTLTFSTATLSGDATGYEEVRELLWISGSGGSATFLAFMVDDDGSSKPMVMRSTDGGANWTKLADIMGGMTGPYPQVQCAVRLASGTLLTGLTLDGEVYRSTDSGATWTQTFRGDTIRAPYTKVRCFHQWDDGTIWMGMQDAGQLWRSDDDGLTWQREHDFGRGAAPFSMTGYGSDMLLVGLGQGLNEADFLYRATVTQFVRSFFNDQETDHV